MLTQRPDATVSDLPGNDATAGAVRPLDLATAAALVVCEALRSVGALDGAQPPSGAVAGRAGAERRDHSGA